MYGAVTSAFHGAHVLAVRQEIRTRGCRCQLPDLDVVVRSHTLDIQYTTHSNLNGPTVWAVVVSIRRNFETLQPFIRTSVSSRIVLETSTKVVGPCSFVGPWWVGPQFLHTVGPFEIAMFYNCDGVEVALLFLLSSKILTRPDR